MFESPLLTPCAHRGSECPERYSYAQSAYNIHPFPQPNACRQQEVVCLGHISATRYIAQGTRCQWHLLRENCIFRPDAWKPEADTMIGPWELRSERLLFTEW